jgi:hypothetical protein
MVEQRYRPLDAGADRRKQGAGMNVEKETPPTGIEGADFNSSERLDRIAGAPYAQRGKPLLGGVNYLGRSASIILAGSGVVIG